MAKVSIDVDEIRKSLKATALTAKAQLTDLAKRAQKDLSQKELSKKLERLMELVKSQEVMQNPRVKELTAKVASLAEQVEKAVTKNASQIVGQVKATMNKSGFAKKAPAKKKANGAAKKSASSETTDSAN